ncbi:hypothetical protein BDV93DRAFT_596869 [Ceratobasidium sp. AG-I]|nr:hypothetical protein BDV93DRAFT_596869 [Ceratobasidium sp. AG-I]
MANQIQCNSLNCPTQRSETDASQSAHSFYSIAPICLPSAGVANYGVIRGSLNKAIYMLFVCVPESAQPSLIHHYDVGCSDSESEAIRIAPLIEVADVTTSGSTPVSPITFHSLGLIVLLFAALKQVDYTNPTEIQSGTIPDVGEGKDVIGVAEVGSGKTPAFAWPVLQSGRTNREVISVYTCSDSVCNLLRFNPGWGAEWQANRELACHIAHQFEALGSAIGVRCATKYRGSNGYDDAEYCAR